MKIIITTSLFPPEIVEPAPYIADIAKLIRNKHKVIIATYSNNPKIIKGVEIKNTKKSNILIIRLLKFTISLFKASKKTNIIYVQNGIAVSLPSMIIAKIKKIPIILRFMEDEAYERAFTLNQTRKSIEEFYNKPECDTKNRFIMFLQKIVLKNADTIITPSDYFKKLIIEKYKILPNKIITIYNPILKKEILPFETKKEKYQIFVNENPIGWKYIEVIIKALKILNNNRILLLIAGKKNEKKNLIKLSKKLNLDNNIKFLGETTRAENYYYKKSSRLHILSGAYEKSPDSIADSLNLNIPIIGLINSANKEIIRNNISGLLVNNDNPKEIAKAIKLIMDDENLENKIIKGGKELINNNFTWDVHVKRLLNVFYDRCNK